LLFGGVQWVGRKVLASLGSNLLGFCFITSSGKAFSLGVDGSGGYRFLLRGSDLKSPYLLIVKQWWLSQDRIGSRAPYRFLNDRLACCQSSLNGMTSIGG
jgi:hypothetical protein